MKKVAKKWARHIHLKAGALGGWCAKCPSARRRTALRSVVKKEGYAVAMRRLNFLRNVANRRNNPTLHAVAGRDVLWMERTFSQKKPAA